jgi:hypothetical protein
MTSVMASVDVRKLRIAGRGSSVRKAPVRG